MTSTQTIELTKNDLTIAVKNANRVVISGPEEMREEVAQKINQAQGLNFYDFRRGTSKNPFFLEIEISEGFAKDVQEFPERIHAILA